MHPSICLKSKSAGFKRLYCNLQLFLFYCRILTSVRSGTAATRFTQAKPDSVWWKIYKNHMTENSFIDQGPSLRAVHHSDEQLAAYVTLDSIQNYMNTNYPCGMNIVWKSHQPVYYSFAFTKRHPLIPYFNHVFKQIKERGLHFLSKKQWNMIYDKSKCASNTKVEKVPFPKIVLPYTLVACGILMSLIIVMIEIVVQVFLNMTHKPTGRSNSKVQEGCPEGRKPGKET